MPIRQTCTKRTNYSQFLLMRSAVSNCTEEYNTRLPEKKNRNYKVRNANLCTNAHVLCLYLRASTVDCRYWCVFCFFFMCGYYSLYFSHSIRSNTKSGNQIFFPQRLIRICQVNLEQKIIFRPRTWPNRQTNRVQFNFEALGEIDFLFTVF